VAKESPGLKVVSYRTPEGFLRKGITTPRLRSNVSSITRAVTSFRSEEQPFSSRMRSRMIRAAKGSVSFQMTEEQKTALRNGFGAPMSAVSGPAGSGKTTVTTCFLRGALLALEKRTRHEMDGGWTEDTGFSVYVTAPTGTAVQRIRRGLDLTHPEDGREVSPTPIGQIDPDATQFLPKGEVGIGTLHSFLGFRGPGRGFDIPEPHPSIIFVDEASMADEPTMAALCQYANRCMSYGAPVLILLAGDPHQLPPVGRGFPFRDLLGGKLASLVPTTRLSKVMRQTGQSKIIEAANRVLNGDPPPHIRSYDNPEEEDFGWVEPPPRPSINAMIDRYVEVLSALGHDATGEDVQVILPLRNRSSVQPEALHMREVNQTLQRRFAQSRGQEIIEMEARNPEVPSHQEDVTFSVGDRVMHVGENEYDSGTAEPIMRGATGRVQSIEDGALRVDYPWVSSPVLYDGPEEVWQLGLAYCLTCHAAQGSEFDYELLSIPRRAGPGMIDRNWLYTAITRAKKDLRMVAPRGRVRKAVRRSQGAGRQTLLTSMEA
jgi:exodeoxyribonuclease V alpha subunit